MNFSYKLFSSSLILNQLISSSSSGARVHSSTRLTWHPHFFLELRTLILQQISCGSFRSGFTLSDTLSVPSISTLVKPMLRFVLPRHFQSLSFRVSQSWWHRFLPSLLLTPSSFSFMPLAYTIWSWDPRHSLFYHSFLFSILTNVTCNESLCPLNIFIYIDHCEQCSRIHHRINSRLSPVSCQFHKWQCLTPAWGPLVHYQPLIAKRFLSHP